MAQFSPRYEIQDVLGSGNFSSVHTALDKITGKTMAVKIMKTHQNIAIKEAALLKSFDHPNIVKLFDFEQDPFTG
jgi:serine/threonine protein kinase